MKSILWAIAGTVLLFFLSVFVIMPIMSRIGYSGAEASYHLATHAFIFALIFTVIVSTIIIYNKIESIKEKRDDTI